MPFSDFADLISVLAAAISALRELLRRIRAREYLADEQQRVRYETARELLEDALREMAEPEPDYGEVQRLVNRALALADDDGHLAKLLRRLIRLIERRKGAYHAHHMDAFIRERRRSIDTARRIRRANTLLALALGPASAETKRQVDLAFKGTAISRLPHRGDRGRALSGAPRSPALKPYGKRPKNRGAPRSKRAKGRGR